MSRKFIFNHNNVKKLLTNWEKSYVIINQVTLPFFNSNEFINFSEYIYKFCFLIVEAL